jgi:MFS family permease
MMGFLAPSRSIAPLNYDRWRIPPAALAIQLSIGQVYAFGAFNTPLTRLLGVSASTTDDWDLSTIGWIFPLAILMLGVSAFIFGRWVDEAGPRKAMLASAACFGGGLLIAALGVRLHEIWIVLLGYGVIGGIGLGIGYVSPISTLIKWFPDRPGMATGLAIAGFAGGTLIGFPFARFLLGQFASATDTGVAATFVAMGLSYFAFMLFGVTTVRLPAQEWRPNSFTSRAIVEPGSGPRAPRLGSLAGRSIGERKEPAPDVHVNTALKTRQFWLIWISIFLFAMAGLGVLGVAPLLLLKTFPFIISAREAAGFTALLVVADLGGRIAWSATSDAIGRKRLYLTSLALAAILSGLVGTLAGVGGIGFFVVACVAIVAIYGGGITAIPGSVRDTFGVLHVGAIHGRLITAWSVAVVATPALVGYLRRFELAQSGSEDGAWVLALFVAAALLVLALAAMALVAPVEPRHQINPPSGFRV